MFFFFKDNLTEVLEATEHRPWEMPKESWEYYQEWNDLLFLHWKVPTEILEKFIPKELKIDTFNNEAWVSLVLFTMDKIHPKYLPAVKSISNFHEINLRTYVIKDEHPAVYFLNIEAEKEIPAFIAKKISNLPYEKANIYRKKINDINYCSSVNLKKSFYFDSKFKITGEIKEKNELEKWLIERYCLYVDKDKDIYKYEIQHKEWELNKVELIDLKLNYDLGLLKLTNKPDFKHYSKGVKVVSWKREKIV